MAAAPPPGWTVSTPVAPGSAGHVLPATEVTALSVSTWAPVTSVTGAAASWPSVPRLPGSCGVSALLATLGRGSDLWAAAPAQPPAL